MHLDGQHEDTRHQHSILHAPVLSSQVNMMCTTNAQRELHNVFKWAVFSLESQHMPENAKLRTYAAKQ